MTSANPHNSADRIADRTTERAMLDIARVIEAPNHTLGEDAGHVVRVVPKSTSTPVMAQIAVDALGDVHVPSMDDSSVVWAVVAYVSGNVPIVLGTWYEASVDDVPSYTAGERRVGHNVSDARLFLNEDGDLTIEDDGGATVTLKDGDVHINSNGGTVFLADDDGTTQPVARSGDPVSGTTSDGATFSGSIDSGSSNVEAA